MEDGELSYNRQVTGPNGGTAFSEGSAHYDDGQLNVERSVSASNVDAVRIGYSTAVLPVGCTKVVVGGGAFYFHNGFYYRPVYANSAWTYTVVTAPIGATVYVLPGGAVIRTIRGVNYYITTDGVYYRTAFIDGRVAYIVVANPE